VAKPLFAIVLVLMADAVARDFARKFAEIERQLQSLSAGHGPIFPDLFLKRCLKCDNTSSVT